LRTAEGEAAPSTVDLVGVYLRDIGRYPLLTKAQEVSFAQRIETGRMARERLESGASAGDPVSARDRRGLRDQVEDGEVAAAEFVQSNLRLVVSIARRYQTTGLAVMDLIQDGNLGLIRAVEKFDWQRGFKFSTYATWWIRQAISRGVSNTGRSIRLPAHVADVVANAYRVRHELFERHGHPVTTAELAGELELSEVYLASLLAVAVSPRSLSETFGEMGDLQLSDRLGDEHAVSPCNAALDGALNGEVERILGCLEEREHQVLRLRFGLDRGEPRTLDEVGEHFDLTRERIRQIEQNALAKLRRPEVAPRLRELLDT
jgi:RNA polymerase sigma factor (sigma-70 family)